MKKKVILFILIIAILSVTALSLCACNNNSQTETGTMQDVLGDVTVTKIAHFAFHKLTVTATQNEVPQREMVDYFVANSGYVYTLNNSDWLFSVALDMFKSMKYVDYKKASESQIVHTAGGEFTVLFLDDGQYFAFDGSSFYSWLDSNGVKKNGNGDKFFNSSLTTSYQKIMQLNQEGVYYESFATYWATLENSRFWE